MSYASAPTNSTATPGRDYKAIAGQLVLDKNVLSKIITIPHVEQRFDKLREGSISLVVEEVEDIGQKELHLMIATQKGTELGEVLSGFSLTPNSNNQGSLLSFRTDTTPVTNSDNDPLEQASSSAINSSQTGLSIVSTEPTLSETTTTRSTPSTPTKLGPTGSNIPNPTSPSSQAAQVTIYRRETADASINSPSTLSQTVSITDADPDQADQGFDRDNQTNQQGGVNLELTTKPGTFAVSLVSTDDELKPLIALGYNTPIPNPAPPTPDPEPAPTPQPEPAPIPEPEPGSIIPIEVDGSRELLVIPFPRRNNSSPWLPKPSQTELSPSLKLKGASATSYRSPSVST